MINDVICKKKEHEALFKKVRQIVGHFKHSISANKLLKNYQKQEKLPEHKFIQDVTTRWNSKYLMINRFLEQKKCVIGLGPYIRLNVFLTNDEWSMLAEISKVLEIFYTVTLTLSKETSSLSEVIPVLRCLTTYLQKEYTLNQSLFSEKLLLSIHKRFPDYEKTKLLTISTILDPRFKDKVFSEENEKNIAVNCLKQELESVYNSWPNIVSTSNEQESSTDNIPILKKSLFRDILPDYREPQQCNTAESEINAYLNKDLLNEDDDIYKYWSKSQFSGLKELANRYHSSPSSSVDSERAFSTAGFICSKSRNALNPEKVRQLIFCSRNIKYLG